MGDLYPTPCLPLKGWTLQPYNSRWLPLVQPQLERVTEDLLRTATRALHGSMSPPRGSGCSNTDAHGKSIGRLCVGMVLLTHRSVVLLAWLHPARFVKKHPRSRVLTGRTRDVAKSVLIAMPIHLWCAMGAVHSEILYSAGQYVF